MDGRTKERSGIPMERQNNATWLRGRVGLCLVLSLEGCHSANISTVILTMVMRMVVLMQLMLMVVAVEIF